MISFVVPAYNEERYLPATLESIHAAARALGLEYEIVVADDASTDSTAELARHGGARVVPTANRQIAKTRNAGARAAAGNRLVFVDADTRITSDVLRAAIAALDGGAVGGGAAPRFEGHAPGWAHFSIGVVVATMRLMNLAAGCFVYCRRDAFDAVGGFDERIFAGEEIYLSWALRKQGRFVMLREEVLTSPRKVHGRTAWQIFWMTVKLLVRNPIGVRRRTEASFWYDGKR